MKHLFDASSATELTARLGQLRSDAPRLWGKMTVSQAMAHCSASMEWAVGDTHPPRMFIGRLIGGLVKRKAIGDEAPLRRNTPTAPSLIVTNERELETEKTRLQELIARFAAGGPDGCTTHPHSFFGRMTADEWAVLMYKHVDHHLRQFGA
jgi:hypothetical protein